MMNKYKAFYKSKEPIIVEAATSYEAQKKAAQQFKAKKSWEVTVVILNGQMPHHLY